MKKLKYYIMGLVALNLCTACNNNDEPGDSLHEKEEVVFNASLLHTEAITSRAGNEILLPYINGIYIQKDGNDSIEYKVRNGNYGTLDPVDVSNFLKWSEEERTKNTEVRFYAWTTPTGVTLTLPKGTATGSIDFSSGKTGGNREPKSTVNDSPQDAYNNAPVTPLEVFVSSYKAGKFQEKPNILLPFKHQVCKVYLEIYDDKNFHQTSNATITFPFIKEKWNIEQGKVDNQGDFIYEADEKSGSLSLDLSTVDITGHKALFYLPPMEGDNSFTNMGDFEITYNGAIYYGSFASRIAELKRGQVMTCRIDLNENYGTGIGVKIEPWINGGATEAPANPYQGIYTEDELKVLKEYLESAGQNKQLPEHLYITDGGKKIIRLYNDLTLTDEEWSLVLEDNMIFDGLGHIVTVPSGKSLFGEVEATSTNTIAINNIRLAGEGQLAASTGAGVTVYNCHANGTGHLVGTAKDGSTFDFCSAEAASTMLAGTTETGTITIQNSFVAYDGASAFVGAGGSGTLTAQNSFIFNTTTGTGTYYDSNGSSTADNISVDAMTGKLVVTTDANTTPPTTTKLIDLLNEASNTLNSTTGKKYWVYVYGKFYPVMRIY